MHIFRIDSKPVDTVKVRKAIKWLFYDMAFRAPEEMTDPSIVTYWQEEVSNRAEVECDVAILVTCLIMFAEYYRDTQGGCVRTPEQIENWMRRFAIILNIKPQ